jgi:hypothetical protein
MVLRALSIIYLDLDLVKVRSGEAKATSLAMPTPPTYNAKAV